LRLAGSSSARIKPESVIYSWLRVARSEPLLLLLLDRLFKSARNPGSAPVVSLYFYARRILA